MKTLHTEAVAIALSTAGPNRLLGTRPPAVDPSEATLPRVTGSTLSQLRSDFRKDTGTYKLFIDNSTDGSCPSYKTSTHTVSHLFSCPVAPTDLVPLDLWVEPRKVASFLASLPSFSHLPPVVPLLPRPPPEPPPPRGRGPFTRFAGIRAPPLGCLRALI
jgi:hypothetical protein